MGFRINTNVASLSAQRALRDTNGKLDKSLEQLSSGNRINKASDDSAGLAISEKLRAVIKSSQQANRNAGDGVSLVQTAEGGLNEISSIIIRLRELSIQSASDTLGNEERAFTDLEFQNLTSEIDRIAGSTQFNGKNLLNGEGESLDFQVGIKNNEFNDRISYSPQDTNASSEALGISGLTTATKEGAQTNLELLDTALNNVNSNRAGLGALQNRLQSTMTNLDSQIENMSASNSRIRDVDVADASAELAKANILSASGTAVLAQANANGQGALRLIG